jgi:predicted Zn-dependent peptidase
MALILVGNVKTSEILSIVRDKFGRLENRPVPERKSYPANPVNGRKEVSAKLSRYPAAALAFEGIPSGSEDEIALQICVSILSNSSRTGLIDKLVIDGDLLSGSAGLVSFKERGQILISAIPYYDINQRRFESLKSTEKTLLKEIRKMQEGNFDEWLVQSIKNEMIRTFKTQMETRRTKAFRLRDIFVYGKNLEDLLNYEDIVASVSIEKIKETAKKYFSSDYYAIFMNEGKPPKDQELEKPSYEPILPVRGAESEYAKTFRLLPVKYIAGSYASMDEVNIMQINDRSKLFYAHNPENDIFTLTLKFGVGTEKMPKLELAAELMNNAGIMGQMKAQEVKQEFGNLGSSCRYSVDDSYLYVIMNGFEENLEASCNLLTRQVLLPQLDEKQMNSLKGGYFQERIVEKKSNESLSEALLGYMLYKDKSEYIDRLAMEDISDLSISDLTGEFQRATDYEAEIHYVGSLSIEQVYDILSKNLPLKQGEKASSSPEVKDREKYAENTVLFLPNSEAKQSTIYFYIEGDEYNHEKDPYIDAFNEYFSGGFSGLVIQEIREYRSMAYSAEGNYYIAPLENRKTFFLGALGTQADKTSDALEVYMNMLNNMPQYPDRLLNIKNYLKGVASVEKPHFRRTSQVYQSWKRRGYTKAPAETNKTAIDNLTFDDIVKFYNENIKGRPVVIAVVGNPKMIDTKTLEKYGKVIKLSATKVFSEK